MCVCVCVCVCVCARARACVCIKYRGCCYETIEEMKEAVTKVIDSLAQEDFHGAFQKFF